MVNAVCLIAAAVKSASIQQTLQEFTAIAALVEPILILSLPVLMLANPWLGKLPFYRGAFFVVLLELALTPTRTQRFRVTRAAPADAAWLRTTLSREGRGLGTDVEQQPDGTLRLRWS